MFVSRWLSVDHYRLLEQEFILEDLGDQPLL